MSQIQGTFSTNQHGGDNALCGSSRFQFIKSRRFLIFAAATILFAFVFPFAVTTVVVAATITLWTFWPMARPASSSGGQFRHLVELVTANRPIDEMLVEMAASIETQYSHAMVAAILIQDQKVANIGTTSNLPAAFVNGVGQQLSRFLIGRKADDVFVTDIANDPLWESLVASAEQIGVRTSIMSPVYSSKGELLGAIVSFYRWMHKPSAAEKEHLKTTSRLASLAAEHRRLGEELAFQAHHDPLTGLPNRVLMEDRLELALAGTGRTNKIVALLYVDLDRFKNINDSLGHESGDLLLRQVTQRFLKLVRKTDTLVRMGGDEFAIILPDLDEREDAVRVAQKLLDVFQSPLQVAGHDLFVSASIGISVYPQDGKSAAELQKNADIAMYRAKNTGSNTIECFAPEMNSTAIERLQLEGQLRRAVENNEFELHYQPQIDNTGHLVGVEALVRWNHPKLGMIPPMKFIPLAEDTGLIVPLGFWVLKEACRQNKAWQQMGLAPFKVAVNVSAMQFQQIDFVSTVVEALRDSGLDAQWLELEITESLLMEDTRRDTPKLDKIREHGISIAIDDFGTGYSSLAYLRKLPIDKLKIDRSFVHEMTAGGRDVRVVQAVMSLAHSLGMNVVAEGVETKEQDDILRELGCNLMQGYFFSKPKPANDIPATVARFNPANRAIAV